MINLEQRVNLVFQNSRFTNDKVTRKKYNTRYITILICFWLTKVQEDFALLELGRLALRLWEHRAYCSFRKSSVVYIYHCAITCFRDQSKSQEHSSRSTHTYPVRASRRALHLPNGLWLTFSCWESASPCRVRSRLVLFNERPRAKTNRWRRNSILTENGKLMRDYIN